MSKNKIIQRLTAVMLSIIMAVGMTPVSAASAVAGVTYVDENGVLRTVTATVIENTTTALTNEWYVVEGSVNTTNLTLTNHNVKLILTDGCTLTANASGDKAAIELFNGNTLTIYGQGLGTGTLTATGSGRGAGIGGSGGANGSTTGEGQAGQAGGDSGSLTVVGGRVVANRIGGGDGGEGISQNEGKKDGGRGGGGGTIIVKGGSLEVSGKVGGGNGGDSQHQRGGDGGFLESFTVTGGVVKVGSIRGGNGGNGTHAYTIGGGLPIFVGIPGDGGNAGSVNIGGGSVYVSGKVGGGDAGTTYYVGETPGRGGTGSTLTVSGGTVIVADDIGGGKNGPYVGTYGAHGTCVITGGSLKVSYLRPTPTNGGANGGHQVFATTVNLDGISETVAVKHLVAGTAYNYGTKDMLTDAEGNLLLWLPDGAVVTHANTESAAYSGTVAAGGSGTLTEMPPDTEKPTALSITPAEGTIDLPESGSISVTFSEVMAPSAGTVSLSLEGGSPINLTGGTWSAGNSVYTIPYSRLSYGGVYTITVSGFQDLAGNIMEDDSSCSFQVKILPIYEYVDEAGVAGTASAIKIDSTTTALSSGWYAAQGSLTLTNLTVNGNVRLILTDGCALTVNSTGNSAAVRVSGGNSLTIYSQTLGTGALTARSDGGGAGIGGNGGGIGVSYGHGENSGTVIFNGGTVTTNRIGGGHGSGLIFNTSHHGGSGGTVTVNGGTVTVSDRIGGGDGSDGNDGGAAGGNGGNGSSLTIRGGNVSVADKIGGGAAGSGYRLGFLGIIISGTAGGAGSCTITGGSVKASEIQPTPKNGDLTASLTTVTLNGVSALQTIQAIVTNLPSTYGTRDMKTDASGKLYLWLPSGALVTDAFSQGSRYTGSVSAGTPGTLAVSGLTPEPPVVLSIVPAHGGADIPINGSISVTFSEVMDVRAGSVALKAEGLEPVSLTGGTWTSSGAIYTVSYSGLSYGAEYTVELSGFRDAYGQSVDSGTFAFTTAAPPKSVMVGAQSGTLICGTAGSAAFPMTVVSIADGAYSVALDGAPPGVTAEDIAISSGRGTLTINTSADTPEESYTMTATIDGTRSDSFLLTVSAALPTVDSVSVSPAAAEVQKGATQQFIAAVTGTNHPAQTVIWKTIGSVSSATGIDASGLLTVGADEAAASLTVKAISTVNTGVSGSATVTVTEVPPAPVYQISLGYMFPAAAEGYGDQTPLTIPVTNTGNQPTGDLTVALGGRNHGDFILSETAIDSISAGGSDCLLARPKNGLAAGIYTATVTVSGGTGINKSVDMSFTVNPASGTAVTGVNSYTPSTPLTASITADKGPGQPTIASTYLTAAVDKDGRASVTIAGAQAGTLIDMAEKNAKAREKTAYGIGVSIMTDLPDTAKAFRVVLSPDTLERLIDEGVKLLEVNGRLIGLTLDLEALREIQRQSTGSVTIDIKPVENLSPASRKLIGTRPVYDVTVSHIKAGKIMNIISLGKGSTILSFPYTPGNDEAVGYLFGVYVDGKGNATRIPGSAYDANSESIIFPADHLSVYGVGYTAPTEKYTDIADHWAKESIDYAVGRGLFSGTTEKTFSPDMAMDRGMLVTVLGRLAGADVSDCKTSSFTDVASGKYCLPYVEWAYKKGVASGIGNGKFAPERAVTRGEFALILQNYAKATGYTLPLTREGTGYVDDSSIGSVYKTAVTAMQQAGIMMGDSGSKFNAKAGATRAEVAAMLHRYVKLTIDPATAQGWAFNDAGQYLCYKGGKPLTGWQTIDGVKYFFNADGTLKTGWTKDGDNWRFYLGNVMLVGFWDVGSGGHNKTCYFTQDGFMVSDKWLQINGKWYYFYADGSLARSTRIDEYEVDENGVRKVK